MGSWVDPSARRSSKATAYPSTAELSCGGTEWGATSGAARKRPRACLSGTFSLSAIGTTRSPSSSSAAVIDSKSPPKAKQSSLSCAIPRDLEPTIADDECGDCGDIVQWHNWNCQVGD